MIKVYAPHGIFEYPTGQAYSYQVGSELDVLDSEGGIIASFDRGRWDHAEDIGESEPSSAEPRVWLRLNDIPIVVTVKDKEGDHWSWRDDSWHYQVAQYRLEKSGPWRDTEDWTDDPNNYGPFTEVIR